MSEGRFIVSLYNTGFQWSIAPGVVFTEEKAAFSFGLRLGYGFDLGPVILVPGLTFAGYFLDPNAYLGMPVLKLIVPINGFAPFIEGGAGLGRADDPASLGLAVMGGGGFMYHFSLQFGLGAEATYQKITGTNFGALGIGPIIAIGF